MSPINKEKILDQFRDIITRDSAKARALIQQLDYKEDPYLLQCIAQTFLDESRFDENGKLRQQLYWRKLRMAEKYIIKAFTIDAECLLVISTMGSVRKSTGQKDLAIYCFEKIIKLGIRGAKSPTCDFHPDFAKELINDAKFELYRLHFDDNPKLSEKYLVRYKKGLEKGINTIYKPLKKFILK